MRIGCCAYSYRKYLTAGQMGLEDFIDTAAQMSLDGVELTAYYFQSTESGYLHALKRRCLARGVAVAGAAVGNRFTLASPEERARQVAMVKEWTGHCVELGAAELRVFAGILPEGHDEEEAFGWTVEALADCAEVAADRGVVLALENHGGIAATSRQVIRLIEAVDSDWLRVNMDNGNNAADPYDEMARLAPYAVTAHAKVSSNAPDGGKRPVDVRRLIATLRDAGYRGFLNIEYEEDQDPKTGVPRFAEEIKAAMRELGVWGLGWVWGLGFGV